MRRLGTTARCATLSVWIVAFFTACDSAAAVGPDAPPDTTTAMDRGTRVLGIAISDRADGGFNDSFLQAVDAGMQATSLPLAWDDLEVQPGTYAPAIDYLAIAASYYAPRGTRLLLEINPIDTNNRRIPTHLDGRSWDDPNLVQAFKDLLSWALPKASELDLVALSIGNEVDALLASDAEWEAYSRFFAEVAAHARALRPGLRVGSKVTYGGLSGPAETQAARLNAETDLVLTTYYPLGAGFQILEPQTVEGVFDWVTTAYAERPVIFAEIGSPSTTVCGSSEALQAEFVRRAFKAWDKHADQIEMIEWVWMHDIDQSALDHYEAYYGLSDACFLEYLGTLGLKHHDGSNKPAWTALAEESKKRGW